MSYATIEAQIQTLIQALGAFDDADVTRGDYRVLDAGSAPYVVLCPGAFSYRPAGDWAQVAYEWNTVVELFERYVGDGSEYTNLGTDIGTIVQQIAIYPSLDGLANVTRATVEPDGGPIGIYLQESSVPQFLLQRLIVRTHEELVHDGSGEYA